jgi:hypothetical protein
MLSLVVSALAITADRPNLMKLRGGGPLPVSAAQAQSAIGYITLAQALVGHAWTKESMEMYEFTGPIEDPTIHFAKFNYALQIAHGLMLTGLADPTTALSVAIYTSTSVQEGLKAPKLPVVAWAAVLLALKHFGSTGAIPAWVQPALVMASALQGTFMWDSMKAMYKLGVPLTKQSDAMGGFVNAAFMTWGIYVLGPLLGWSSAQTFGVYGLTYTAYILKLVLVDGVGLFNPAGGYVWAGLFGAAGVAALTA